MTFHGQSREAMTRTHMLYTVCMASWSVAQSGQTVMAGKSSSCSFTLSMVEVLGSLSQSLVDRNRINFFSESVFIKTLFMNYKGIISKFLFNVLTYMLHLSEN